jgi:hypothetical protein
VLAGLQQGHYPSVRAAAVAAGLVVPQVTLRLEPVCIARQLLKHLTPADVRQVVTLLTDTAWLAGPLGDARRRRPREAAVEAAA